MTSQPWIPCHCAGRKTWRRSFNGAMTSQPWIQASRSPLCRLRHSFNGAMTSQPWIRRAQAASGVRGNYGFNGAMTSQPWIRPPRRGCSEPIIALQWSHDLSAMDTCCSQCHDNLSARMLQWSHDLSAMDTRPKRLTVGCTTSLQWSHDLSAMDTQSIAVIVEGSQSASMEP